MTILVILAIAATLAVPALAEFVRRRHIMQWLPGYLRSNLDREVARDGPVHIMFCFVDHFEPAWKRPPYEVEVQRVERWCRDYPGLASRFTDADGCHPKHTFFYPEEEYRPEHLESLSELCARGFGEIEVHLHHDRDTSDGLREKLRRFARILSVRHGALGRDRNTGAPAWGFIHGNWCLDNSGPDGRWCGVNNELQVLKSEGCYADYTLPSAPSPTQTATVNSIYYATDDPLKPKSHDRGTPVRVGTVASGDLMIIQGVLGWDWASRKFGLLPRIENSDVRKGQPPSRSRVDQWVRLAPSVRGRPEWKFIKIHTHGAPEAQAAVLLGEPVERMYQYLSDRYNDGREFVLHYVSAREVYNIVKAAESGASGDPRDYRDFLIAAPDFLKRTTAAAVPTDGTD